MSKILKNQEKVYDKWNEEKQKIHFQEHSSRFVSEREVWFVKMGINIGYEENGKSEFVRPVIVIKKIGNMFISLALTSKGKLESKYYHRFENISLQNPKYKSSSYAILSQIKSLDKKRFVEKVGIISTEEYLLLTKKLRTLLF